MAETRPKIDLAASGRFSGAVQILDVRLKSSFFTAEATDLELEGFHTEYFADVTELSDKRLTVTVSFRLADHRAGHEETDGPVTDDAVELSAFADFEVTYELVGKVDPADAESFAWINCVMNAWSYWRTLTHNMLVSMGLPASVVPVFRVENEALGRPAAAKEDTAKPAKKAPARKRVATAK